MSPFRDGERSERRRAMADRWRKGLRATLAVLLMAAVGAVGACGGGDDDNDYNFNGTWTMTSQIVQSNLPGFPVGLAGVDVAKVAQSGTTIAVGIEGTPLQNGTCDPNAGTFAVSGVDGPLVLATNGTRVDDNTMSGEWTMAGGPYLVRATHTMELVTRNLAAGAQVGKPGFAAKAAQALK
jgi:hypothetical protein